MHKSSFFFLVLDIWFQSDFINASNRYFDGLRSVAGLVIQAAGRTECEDALRLGSPGGVLSDNPSVCTSSLVTLVL